MIFLKKYLVFFLLCLVPLCAVACAAQKQKKKKKASTAQEQKKAGIKRTLKEKKFHLPDTTGSKK